MAGRPPILLAAAHRLLFLTGAMNLLLLMLWWAVTLFDLHIHPIGLPMPDVPVLLLHAPAMLYLLLPPFIFGFLLTVFPRWAGYPDLVARQYAPVGIAFGSASILGWTGLMTATPPLLLFGFAVAAIGWLIALWHLLAVLRMERRDRKPPTWHAWSTFAALAFGFAGLVLVIDFLIRRDANAYLWATRIGTFGFMAPVFMTVAHRMIPFFAGSIIENYVRWRPYWILAALWGLLLLHLALNLGDLQDWQWITGLALMGLTGLMLWRWWPRAPAPGLLQVLILGFAWAPIGFALIAVNNLTAVAGLSGDLGRAPVHALYVGMAGSLIIAMVTRVTQGHSGRPLEMPRVAWIAFWGIQASALARIIAGIRGEHGHWLFLAALIWTALVAPWVLRQSRIYCAPRVDGRPG